MYILFGVVAGLVIAILLAIFFVKRIVTKGFRIFLLALNFVGCISFGVSCSGYIDSYYNIEKGIDNKITAIESEAQKYGAGLMSFDVADIAKLNTAILTATDRTKTKNFYVDRELTKVLKSKVSVAIIECLPSMIGRNEEGEPIFIKDVKVNMHDVLVLSKAETIPVMMPLIKKRAITFGVTAGVFVIMIILCSIINNISVTIEKDTSDENKDSQNKNDTDAKSSPTKKE